MNAIHSSMSAAGLVRPASGRILAGVCSGIARKLNVSTGIVRGLFVVSVVLPGSQVLVYLLGMLLMPNESALAGEPGGPRH